MFYFHDTMSRTSPARFKTLYQVLPDDAAAWSEAGENLIQGGEAMVTEFLNAWPYRRLVELFAARNVDLPPVMPSSDKVQLAARLWNEVLLDESDDFSSAVTALLRILSNLDLYPMLPDNIFRGEKVTPATKLALLRANVVKVKLLNKTRDAWKTISSKSARQVFEMTHLAHPAWFGRAVLVTAMYTEAYKTIKAFQVPKNAGHDTSDGSDDDDSTSMADA